MKDIEKNIIMEEIANALSISPGMFNYAKSRVKHIDQYLNNSMNVPLDVSFQGSFLLGTTVKPYEKDKNRNYDVDLIVRFKEDKNQTSPKEIKSGLGTCLKKSEYNKYLEEEGKRCWTLDYSDENIPEDFGFHIDLLPCVSETNEKKKLIKPFRLNDEAIAITKRKSKTPPDYVWESSNPLGYKIWFDEINSKRYAGIIEKERETIYKTNKDLFKTSNDVSNDYVRTPLQKVIQILKRHRDVMFTNPAITEFKPASIILTTIVTTIVNNSNITYNNTYELLNHVLLEVESSKEKYKDASGRWEIINPADSNENFADRWIETPRKSEEFFKWLKRSKSDLLDAFDGDIEDIKKSLKESLGLNDSQINSINATAITTSKTAVVGSTTPKPYTRNERLDKIH